MPRSLSHKSTPALLKQEASRWHAALKSGDAESRKRLALAWPAAPADASLRDVQHALAREYGFVDWKALRAALDDLAVDRQSRAEQLDALLRHGWDGDAALARRLVARVPDLARDSIFSATTCGDVAVVDEWLARDPAWARRTGGPLGWTALACVCYGRLDDAHAVAIATRLLDAGADPSFAFDDGWGNPFTPITGAIGLGEGVKPSHPQAGALVTLLLERGANPFDTQALYNDSIAHDDPQWMALLWDASERAGRLDDWSRRDGKGLGGRIKVGTLNYLLGNAVTNRHHRRAAWLLAHGADARTVHSYSGRAVHTEARLAGDRAMLTLLEAHGAAAEPLGPAQSLDALLMAGDLEAARELVRREPAALETGTLARAAGHGNATAVRMLLDLGANPDARDADGATALHRAAHAQAIDVIDLLLERGAAVDVRDHRWQATPLGWAVVTKRPHAAERLAQVSQDIWALTESGRVARLGAVLDASPGSAREVRAGAAAPTPLFRLPEDDEAAAEVVALLLSHGTDPRVRDGKGKTAAEVATFRGLDAAGEMLRAATP
ncbi:MAG: ankyrin repeat domain-containing protein [Gemmatimonadaceae bacterium]|nr:ankyrin repeat domain-containing protein [Gemmatimonadaceae bacterium]